jgi:hypothetical protein
MGLAESLAVVVAVYVVVFVADHATKRLVRD